MSDDELVRLITDQVLSELDRNGWSQAASAGRADGAQIRGAAVTQPPRTVQSSSSTVLFPQDGIPIGVSVRHIHLARGDCDTLFGKGYELRRMKELYQRNQFACEETLTVVGPKGCLSGVRVLAPLRRKTQIEVARTDAIQLGTMPGIFASVHEGSGSPCALAGPKGSILLDDSLIRMKRHIHLHPDDASALRVKDGDEVDVRIPGSQGLIFCNTRIRVHEEFRMEMHIDTDEANAAGVCCGQRAFIVNDSGAAHARCALCAL